MIAYRVQFGKKIESFEYRKETEHFFVTGKNSRQPKNSSYEMCFHTWDEAKAFVVARAEQAIESAKLSLERAYTDLGKAKALEQ